MRRLAAILPLILLSAACSPRQEALWRSWHHQDPSAAQEWALNDCGALCTNDTNHNGIVEPDSGSSDAAASSSASNDYGQPDHPGESDRDSTASGQCAQWHGTAIGVGFSEDEWPTVDRIMYAESRCNPGAYNSQEHFGGHASGLMQIIWPTWAGECGISDPFDPWQNLSCAEYLAHTYGWGQWSTY